MGDKMQSGIKFISTKLKIPAPRKNYIKREGLFERLSGIPEYRMVLIKGAAGSGKTTLLASFIREKSLSSVKWITLDSDNDNTFSFWYYFIEAVKDCLGSVKEDVISLFDAVIQKDDVERLISILINELDTAGDIIVVLDDFHNISDGYLLETIEYFIKHVSGNVHMILLTREEPAFYLSDLAMSGRLLLIDEEDLKLSRDEGECFLRDTLRVDLKDEILSEINELSEGWIGGLQLVALASAGKKSAVIKDIRVLNKYVVEYLSREIIDSLHDREKEFLVKTSILSYFNETICNKLLGISDSGDIIEGLLDKNLFLINVDEDSGTYRYHNIFSEFLKLRFSKLGEDEKTGLHLKASKILSKLGDHDESVRHLMETGRYKEALEVIELMDQSFKGWVYLSRIPLEYLKDNRDMAIQRLFYHYYNSEVEELKNLFDTFKEEMERDDEYWKVLKISKSILIDLNLKTDIMSLDEIENMNFSGMTKAVIFLKTAAFLYIQFKFNESLAFVEKASEIESALNNPYVRISILNVRSGAKEEMGDLLECEKIYEEIFELIEKYKILSHMSMNFYVGITGIFLKSARLDKAEASLNKAVQNAGRDNIYIDAGYLYNLMELKLLKGEKKEACEAAKQLLEHEMYQELLFASGLIKYLLYLDIMTPGMADKYLKACEECGTEYLRIEDKLAYSRVLYFKGREREALEIVDTLLQIMRINKIKFKLVEALLFKMNILNKNRDLKRKELTDLLREAVYYSYENRIISPYILEWETVKAYMGYFRDERVNDLSIKEKGFISEITGICESDKANGLLSGRETEVLYEMSTGASNREIAERLCISVATVKTHIINIYSKLQVGSRVEAVDRAKKEGFLK